MAARFLASSSQSVMVNLLTLNVSASLNVFRLIANPSLCLPHHTVPTFNHLPIPLHSAFFKDGDDSRIDIRAVVLDKDNCFAVPKQNEVHKPYKVSESCAATSSSLYFESVHVSRSISSRSAPLVTGWTTLLQVLGLDLLEAKLSSVYNFIVLIVG